MHHDIPHGTQDNPTVLMITPHGNERPDGTQDIPHGTHDIPHGTHDIPHGTAHTYRVKYERGWGKGGFNKVTLYGYW